MLVAISSRESKFSNADQRPALVRPNLLPPIDRAASLLMPDVPCLAMPPHGASDCIGRWVFSPAASFDADPTVAVVSVDGSGMVCPRRSDWLGESSDNASASVSRLVARSGTLRAIEQAIYRGSPAESKVKRQQERNRLTSAWLAVSSEH